mgnify:CR=1 FL=1
MKWSDNENITKNDSRWSTAEKRYNQHCNKEQTIKMNYKRARRNYIKRQFITHSSHKLV